MKRPKSVTFLAVGVLTLAGIYLLRFFQAVKQWEFLLEFFPSKFTPAYLVLSGVLWGGIGLALAWGLWSGRRWAPPLTRILIALFAVYSWLDSLFLAADPAVASANLFRAASTLVLLVLTFWILSRPGTKLFFGVTYDRSSED
jgi:hypothetical protein